MYLKYKKMVQLMTLFSCLWLANGTIFAGIPNEKDSNRSGEDVLFTGVLSAVDAQSVKVNGTPAQDGMTILSGAEITTTQSSGATITIPRLGRIELRVSTSVKLVFMAGHVELQLLTGDATLTTLKGVTGVLTLTDGKVLKTDSSLEVSAIKSSETELTVLPQPNTSTAAPSGLSGLWIKLMSISGVVGGTVSTWEVINNQRNSSQNSVSRVQP